MAATREQVYQALYALTDGVSATFKTRGRRIKLPENVASEQQPALFQVQTGEVFEPLSGTPPLRRMGVAWVIYTNVGEDANAVPSTEINPILDTLEALLKPAPGKDKVTLAGIVAYARFTGNVEISEGVLGQQAVSIMHVEILFPEDFTC